MKSIFILPMASSWVAPVTICGTGPHTFALSLADTEYTQQPANKILF